MAGSTVSDGTGRLNIFAKRGQSVSQLLDFSISLTGYTFTAEIVSAVTYSTVVALVVTSVNLSAGQVNVGISASSAANLSPGSYLWRLVWTPPGGDPRTALDGIWEIVR
jgi:hypothetical protein